MIGAFALFSWELGSGAGIEHARTVAVNTLVAFEIFYLSDSRSIRAPVLNREGLMGNPYLLVAVAVLIVLQLAFTPLGPLQTLFATAPIGSEEWLRIVLVASSVLCLVELEKWLVRRREARALASAQTADR
jgi:magnesium-transporting ATPase (P-type)